MGIFKKLGGSLVAVALLTLALSLITIHSCSDEVRLVSDDNSNGTCDNVGEVYPDNPFSGWPVSGGVNWGAVTAIYCDPDYFEMFGSNHWGIDLGYSTGTSVVATAGGIVSAAEWNGMMGNYVRICSPDANGWCATYMHLSSLAVFSGMNVANGGSLGEVGSTGNSTGSHLHYQINDPDLNTVDPAPTMAN